MAGTNYMGGRRNAAKARVRDADGRLKRDHFGKQRLSVLAKGLGRTAAPQRKVYGTHDEVAHARIPFAHAHRLSKKAYMSEKTTPRSIPGAYMLAPLTPPRKISQQNLDDHFNSARSRSSAILNELDLCSPLLLRAEINRLLDLPDFVGLSQGTNMKENHPCRSLHNSDDSTSAFQRPDPEQLRATSLKLLSAKPHISSSSSEKFQFARGSTSLVDATTADGSEFELMHLEDDDVFAYGLHNDSGYAEDVSLCSDVTIPTQLCLEGINTNNSRDKGSGSGSPDSCSSLSLSSKQTRDKYPNPFRSSDIGNRFYVQSEDHSALDASSPCESTKLSILAEAFDYSPRSLRDIGQYVDTLRPRSPSDLHSPSPPPKWPSSMCMQESLLSVVNGQLFENSNPWRALQNRLGFGSLQTSRLDRDETPRLTQELRANADRSGLGYRAKEAPSVNDVWASVPLISSMPSPASRGITPPNHPPFTTGEVIIASPESSDYCASHLAPEVEGLHLDHTLQRDGLFIGQPAVVSSMLPSDSSSLAPAYASALSCVIQTSAQSTTSSISTPMFDLDVTSQTPPSASKVSREAGAADFGEDPLTVTRSPWLSEREQGEQLIVGPCLFSDEGSEEGYT